MELVLESALVDRDNGRVANTIGFRVLVSYDDCRLVHSTMELLRTAASRIGSTRKLFCAIWNFEFLTDPLLLRFAAREISAADMIIVATREEVPKKVKDWFNQWLWTHPDAIGVQGSLDAEEGSDRLSPRVEEIGRLGNIDLLAIGGGEVAGGELKRRMRLALAAASRETFGTGEESTRPRQALREEEYFARRRDRLFQSQPAILDPGGQVKQAWAAKKNEKQCCACHMTPSNQVH